MERSKEKINALILQGESFTYHNFSTKCQYGYPDAFAPEWLAWQTHVKNAICSLFKIDSAPVDLLRSGHEVEMIGDDANKFELAKSYFLGALNVAKDALEDDALAAYKMQYRPLEYFQKRCSLFMATTISRRWSWKLF